MWFTRVSLNNPVLATMMMLALMVLGLFSLQRLNVDLFPDVDFPVIVVSTRYPGAAPEIVESEVTKKVEEGVVSLSGIKSLSSRSYEGVSVVIIEFNLDIDSRKAINDVREKVDAVRPLLRSEVKESRVLRYDPSSEPIWSLAVLPAKERGMSQVELSNWAEQVLKTRLANVAGVGAVNLTGDSKREINIYLKPLALAAFGIGVDQVAAVLSRENQDYPVGIIRSATRERTVQLALRVQRPQDFGQIIVARKNGAAVRLHQIASIEDSAMEINSLALYNGQRTLLLNVQKLQDENTIAVVDGLRQAVQNLKPQTPPGVELIEINDSSRRIRVAVTNVTKTLIEGATLTVLIVFLFLNSWRSTIITGLTLPIALVGTFFFMQLFGFTINVLTLMALSLCVGLLIDDAIVVRENIVRHVQMGKSPFQAALEGTQEIGLAVFATTLSIVAVFLPIGFMGGIIGRFFHQFGLTIVSAVLISMFVSFTLDPMLSSLWHDPSIKTRGQHQGPPSFYDRSIGRVTGWFGRATEALTAVYQGILRRALRHKLLTLAAATAVFVTSIAMLPLLGTEFVPDSDTSETQVVFDTPPGSALEVTEARAHQVEAIVRSFPEVKYTLSRINSGQASSKTHVNIYIRLVDPGLRQHSAGQISNLLRQRLSQVSGISVTQVGLNSASGSKPVKLSIQGPDLGELKRLSAHVLQSIKDIPGLVDAESPSLAGKPTLEIRLRADSASDLGLEAGQIASSLRTLLAGSVVGNWRAQDDQTYDVNLRLAEQDRRSIADLQQLPFTVGSNDDGSARVLRLGQVADVIEATGSDEISRKNLTREIAISANVFGRSTGEVAADVRKVLQNLSLPAGYRYQFGGSSQDMRESFAYALSALMLAVIFIYMILASQFKSFLQPLTIMTALPLTLIGVVAALLLFNSTLSMFSVIGIIMLMGLVTKNAILLVDFAIRARQYTLDEQGQVLPGLPRHEALLLAAKVRLRPILMTTLAMIFGMLPLALAWSEGSEVRAPMGQAVIGGVIASSLLTLVVVPVAYCYMDDLAVWLGKKWGLRQNASPDSAPAPKA